MNFTPIKLNEKRLTVHDVMTISLRNGSYFFHPDTMEAWGTTIESGLYNNNLFITRDRGPSLSGRKVYIIRRYDPDTESVETVCYRDDCLHVVYFDTKAEAKAFCEDYGKYCVDKRTKMWRDAGYRERYAMEHGYVRPSGLKADDSCIEFVYPHWVDYQDANGAIYDTIEHRWVN